MLRKRLLEDGPIRRFLKGRKEEKEEKPVEKKAPVETEGGGAEVKPLSGKSYEEQSQEEYCLECIEAHTMKSLTEMRHAIDRFRTAGKMTYGVTEKVRVSIGEIEGITEDVKNTQDASPDVKKGLNEILDEVRWIRKDYGLSGKGLTIGRGGSEELEELRKHIFALQLKAYALVEKCPTCKKVSRTLEERLKTT